MSCLLVECWLNGCPSAPGSQLAVESWAVEKGVEFPPPAGATFQPLLPPALLLQLGPSYPLGCRR